MSFIINPYIYGGTSYLLDDYSAAAAYSLRQLKTGVTNVVRVRRSSDSAESDFTAAEVTDGTLTTWTGANDGFVVTWYDQEGTNDASQSTAANQPQLVSGGSLITAVNGKPTLSLNGTSQYFSLTNVISTPTAITEFHVFERATSGIKSFAFGNDTTAYPFLAFWFTDDKTYWRPSLATGVNLDSGNTSTSDFLLTAIQASNTFYLWKNGSSKGSTAHTLGSARDLNRLFKRNTDYHNGYSQEVILYESDQTSNRTDIETDINDHYSIY